MDSFPTMSVGWFFSRQITQRKLIQSYHPIYSLQLQRTVNRSANVSSIQTDWWWPRPDLDIFVLYNTAIKHHRPHKTSSKPGSPLETAKCHQVTTQILQDRTKVPSTWKMWRGGCIINGQNQPRKSLCQFLKQFGKQFRDVWRYRQAELGLVDWFHGHDERGIDSTRATKMKCSRDAHWTVFFTSKKIFRRPFKAAW